MKTMLAILICAGSLVGCASTSKSTKENSTCPPDVVSSQTEQEAISERQVASANCPQDGTNYEKAHRSFELKR